MYDFISYIYTFTNFEIYFFIIYAVSIFSYRSTFSFRFYLAPIYYIAYATVFIYCFYNPYYNLNSWTSPIEFSFAITQIKFSIILFWFLFTKYLSEFYQNEYFVKGEEKILCIDLAFCGSILLVSSNNIIEMFIAIELISFPTYVFIALDKNKYATEAALRYFLFSVFGTLCFILSFILLYISTGQVIPNLLIIQDITNINIVFILWSVAFFTKIGIGPFMQWVPAIYQAISGPVFIFTSILVKIPLVIPIIYITNWFFVNTNMQISNFISTILLIFGGYFAAKNLFTENNFRKIFAYTGIINFTIATISLIYSNDPKIFIFFFYLYLISSFTVYIWHSITNANKFNKFEKNDIEKFNKSNKFAGFILTVILIINSGLPPVTLFFFKLFSIGAISKFKIIENQITTFSLIVILLIFSILAYYSYFKILLAINSTITNTVPVIQEKENSLYTKKYQFAIEISLITIIYFFINLKYLMF